MTIVELKEQVLNCRRCKLRDGCKQVVFGEGSPDADIMFIGEAPGKTEDETGKMFVGAAGKVLDELLAMIDLKRSDVFITNLVKCRPGGNRDPKNEEIEKCSVWLENQLKLISPKFIIPLGRFAMNYFLPGIKISKVHGRYRYMDDRVYFTMYHPAVALYRPELKECMIKDFKILGNLLSGEIPIIKKINC